MIASRVRVIQRSRSSWRIGNASNATLSARRRAGGFTSRHGLFTSYEAFAHIVDSMFSVLTRERR
ncbi:hypothetical protein [Ilumatobacter sp.]|uniref:hypothetical protein n=1 Tax=Ilumatobacter sp. TaxID=1967498 RepID=UPI003C760B26